MSTDTSLHWADIVVIVLYLAGSLGLGIWVSLFHDLFIVNTVDTSEWESLTWNYSRLITYLAQN